MSEIVNLNRVRKARARTERERQAADNRARFGRSKAEKDAVQKRENRDAARHEGHRLSDREEKDQ